MTQWQAAKGNKHYLIQINNYWVELSYDEGTPETYGGKSISAKVFLKEDKWQQHVKEIFGNSVLDQVMAAAQSAAKQEHPHLGQFASGTACPYCGLSLRTARSKQCPHCLKSWRDTKEGGE